MTHIKITKVGKNPPSLLIDGEEWNAKILAQGFSVRIPEDPYEEATVTVVIPAETLEMDMPEAMLSALRDSEEVAK